MSGLSASMLNENKILARLNFSSMYYREDSVIDAEAKTYQWITDEAPKEQEQDRDERNYEPAARKSETRESFLHWL